MGTTSTSAAVWGMLADRYRKALQAKARSEKTIDRYLATITRWTKWLDQQGHDLEPDEVEAHNIDDFVVDIITASSPANAAHHYRNLRAFFGWLIVRKQIKTGNPFDETEPPSVPEKITELLDDEHHAALLLTCEGRSLQDLRDRAIILLFIDTGMRVSELQQIPLDAGAMIRTCGWFSAR
jgi:site-specific recombinase XerD